MRFEDKIAIVTGSAGGIGLAIAGALIKEGARVALVDMQEDKLAAAREGLGREKERTLAIGCNITDSPEVKAMVQRVKDTWGRVDILVNNAGIIRRGSIETVTEADWDQVISVNLKGTFLCCHAVVPVMKSQGYGKIVNVSSIAGKTGDITSAPGYGPSKAGIDALTKTLARQLAPYGINVNAVSPHAIETEMSAQWSAEKRREVISSIPLGRMGKPADVAAAVLFLASDDASFITGEILDVNGGALMD